MNRFYFKPNLIGRSIRSLYGNQIGKRFVMDVLDSIAEMESWMIELREALSKCGKLPKLSRWDESFSNMQQRYQEYFSAADGSENESELRKYSFGPLFDGEYPDGINLSSPPKYPDIESSWHLANDLIRISNSPEAKARCQISVSKSDLEFVILKYHKYLNSKATPSPGVAEEGAKEDINKYISDHMDDYIEEKIEKFVKNYGAPVLIGLGVLGAAWATSSRSRRN